MHFLSMRWETRSLVSSICFFFFQAEDGIRGGHVTGVQTCALPISTELKEGLNVRFLRAAPSALAISSFTKYIRVWLTICVRISRVHSKRLAKASQTSS